MRIRLLVAMLAAALTGGPAYAAPLALPHLEGPDRPAVTAPDAVVTVFRDYRFDGCAGIVAATSTIAVPAGAWDRVVVQLDARTDGDPWDRLFSVAIGGAEVLRGTTPRVDFTVRRDVTEYASLLPAGGTADVRLELGTYVGAWLGTLTLEFYADEPTAALVAPAYDEVHPVFLLAGLNGHGTSISAPTTFGPAAPAGAVAELTVTNHGPDEAMFSGRIFRLFVDGREIATLRPMPYTYAILGFGAANANAPCSGPATTPTGQAINGALWWTAQRAADPVGVHVGPGEIPPYRAVIDAADLPLLAGGRTVEIRQEAGRNVWVTSLSFLLDR